MLINRYIMIRFTAADPENVITALAATGVEITRITWIDYLTVEIRIRTGQRKLVHRKLEKLGISFSVVKQEGALWRIQKLCYRPVLLTGILIFILLLLLLPDRVLLIEIAGNRIVPRQELLQKLEDCGVHLGVNTADLRSESIKNKLMEKTPELQWIGVTVSGCKVTIHVRERSSIVNDLNETYPISSIIASRDGVISEMIVYRGNPLFREGASVKAGDVIISGYTDCGIKTVVEQANGEVFAYTQRECSAITPTFVKKRENKMAEHSCYRFQIGKKVINLCNHSGISGTTCDKMYSEYYWSLPGGFPLPVCFTKIDCVEYDVVITNVFDEVQNWLPEFAREYTQSQMVAGSILKESIVWNIDDGVSELCGNYACHEMIGREKREEIIGEDAKDN